LKTIEIDPITKINHKPKKDSSPPAKEANKDDSFREFRRLCAALSDTDSYTGKTAHVRDFFTKGTDGSEYRNPLRLYCMVSVIAVPSASSSFCSNLDPETGCLESESLHDWRFTVYRFVLTTSPLRLTTSNLFFN
jgi:hypothetical protein